MENRKPLILLLLLLVTWSAATAFGKSAAVLLREGLYAEEMEGDLEAAIKIYQEIIDDSAAQRKQVAQALYRQGMCYLKQRDEIQAQAAFRMLVIDYRDQTELVEKAKPMLEELGNADPASLMPPETLLYVEIGSPGRQVETILNMLKGTPLENPLAAIGGGQPQEQSTGSNNPAAMLSRVLNPAMMSEFKTIRGIGVGVTSIAEDAPVTVVFFPGKSDTLRGLLQMILGFFGRPVDAIEGMQTVAVADGGYVAYDGTVVIGVSPSADAAERLRWSVRQYKGVANDATLASHNASFGRISKQLRQQSAVTVWLDVDNAYQKLQTVVPTDELPEQFHVADAMIDLKHVDDVIASLSLRETGVALEANVRFQEGHQSMAYNMIRTPHLDRNVLKAVPPDAIALISFTLGQSGTPQADAASQQLKNLTGMDIGAELFANLEQISLFALPTGKIVEPQAGQMPAALGSLGLVIKSTDLQQTRQLLTQLLQSANLLMPGVEPTDPVAGAYQLTLANEQNVFCHMNERSKTTVVSLNPEVLKTSITALAGGVSARRGGRLGDMLTTLSPTTSKLVAVNVAGALRFAAENMNLPSEETATEVRAALAQLASSSEKTTVRLQTNEEENSLGIRLSVSDLPPAGEVFGPIQQIVEAIQKMEAQQAMWKAQAEAAIGIAPAAQAPAIDGRVDEVWSDARSHTIQNVVFAPVSSTADLSASFKALWDDDNLYLLVDVTDDDLRNDSDEFWLDDGIELFVDADNSKSDDYTDNDYQFYFGWDRSRPVMGEEKRGITTGVAFAMDNIAGGYRTEIKLPWSTLGTKPAPGVKIGLDVHVDDDDQGGERDSKLLWHAKEDVAYLHPRAFGTAELQGLVGWWKFDEGDGTQAADSSGNGHTGTLGGNPTWQPAGGKVGGALDLDGDGDLVDIGEESKFDATAGVTVAAWIKIDTWSKPWQAIVTKGDSAWRIQRNQETSTLEFACSGVSVPDGSIYGSLYGQTDITPGQWHHIVGVYDGSNMALYIDGTLDAAQKASGPISANDLPVLIGANAEMADRFFDGAIDDVRVYNYGLSAAAVVDLARGR